MKKSIVSRASLAVALTAALCAAAPLGLFAEEAAIVTDEDALFGGEDDAAVAEGTAGIDASVSVNKDSGVSAFLKTASVRVGGSISPGVAANWVWLDPYSGASTFTEPSLATLAPDVSSLVFIDARPSEDFRAYLSVKTAYPFFDTTTTTITGVDPVTGLPTTATTTTRNTKVFELFSDFNVADRAFFRFGKHSVKWGVGYFFSPADVISLESIDVTDYEKQREGPVSLRLNVPIPGRQDNVWAYAILPEYKANTTYEPLDLGFAGKYELVVGGWELSAGGAYRRDVDPSLMATASGALGPFGLFGEAVCVFNKDYSADDAATGDLAAFNGTAGVIYTNSNLNLTAIGQYNYSGTADLDTRRQYAALYVSKSKCLINDLTVSLLGMSNLSDLSFMVKPTVSWAWNDYATLSLSPTFTFATDALWGLGDSAEYVSATAGPAITLSVTAYLGSGKF